LDVHFLTRPYILDKLLNEGPGLVLVDESQTVQLFEIGSLDVVVAELVVAVVLRIYFKKPVLVEKSNLLSEIEYDFVGEVQLALHVLAELYSEAERQFGVGRQCMFGSPDLVTLD